MQTTFSIPKDGPGFYDFTDAVRRWTAQQGDGLLTLFVRHTSCSLLIQENADPDVRHDLDAFFARLVPAADATSMAWLRHRLEGPDDMPAHIKAALLPVSLSIPVTDGCPALGTGRAFTFMNIALRRTGGRSRRILPDPISSRTNGLYPNY